MLFIRRSATLAVLVVLACTVALLGDVPAGSRPAAAAARTRSVSPAAAIPPRVAAQCRASRRVEHRRQATREPAHPPGLGVQLPEPRQEEAGRHPQAVLNTIKSTWGGPRYSYWIRAAFERQDPDRHVDVRRLGDRAGAVLGAQAWRECPGARGQGPQQASTSRGSGCAGICPHSRYRKGHPETAEPVELRPALQRLLSGQWRHAPLEVLPVHQRRRLPRALDHHADLDEPDPDGLRGPVEPRDDHLATTTCTARSAGSSRESRRDRPSSKQPTAGSSTARCTSIFFPRPAPLLATTRSCGRCAHVHCKDTTGRWRRQHRTQIRVIQYAMYNDRGVWIAKRLKRLWNAGCNIKIIYAVTSRPVLASCAHGRVAARSRCGSR